MSDTYYFSHDYNARNNDKIKALIRKHGLEGYGLYWAIVEDLYNNDNELQLDCDGIAYDLRVHPDLVQSVINDFGLFVIEGSQFGSMSVQKRLDKRDERSKKARANALKRWSKYATALPPHSNRNAIKERKGKERDTLFNDFWDRYDKKVDRKKAEAKWNKLSDQDRTDILATVDDYVKSKPDPQYRPNPLTYLNGERWKDEVVKPLSSLNDWDVKPDDSENVANMKRKHGKMWRAFV